MLSLLFLKDFALFPDVLAIGSLIAITLHLVNEGRTDECCCLCAACVPLIGKKCFCLYFLNACKESDRVGFRCCGQVCRHQAERL